MNISTDEVSQEYVMSRFASERDLRAAMVAEIVDLRRKISASQLFQAAHLVLSDEPNGDGEVTFYSRIYLTKYGIPVMTDSSYNGPYDVELVFRSGEGRQPLIRIAAPHLAAPAQAQLPIEARKAMQGVIDWDANRNYLLPYRVRDPIIAILRSTGGDSGAAA